MTVAGTRTALRVPHLRDARFDPRLVLIGLLLLASGTVGGFAMAGQARQAADDVAAPVAALCQEGGPTGAQLADTGACTAAQSTGVGPFQSELVTGANGARGPAGATGQPGQSTPGTAGAPGTTGTGGTPGTNGAAGTPGVAGTGGTTGADGVTPACVSEPGQCRGPEGSPGKPGDPGASGAPGAAGMDGRGITDTRVENCRLIVFYTDGATNDAGPVCATESSTDPEPAG